jgi:hypothetical protein
MRVGASVVIVDNFAGFRARARRLLECEGYRVVGETADSASALEAAREPGCGARRLLPKADLSRDANEELLP